jgi:hypothetical protein
VLCFGEFLGKAAARRLGEGGVFDSKKAVWTAPSKDLYKSGPTRRRGHYLGSTDGNPVKFLREDLMSLFQRKALLKTGFFARGNQVGDSQLGSRSWGARAAPFALEYRGNATGKEAFNSEGLLG